MSSRSANRLLTLLLLMFSAFSVSGAAFVVVQPQVIRVSTQQPPPPDQTLPVKSKSASLSFRRPILHIFPSDPRPAKILVITDLFQRPPPTSLLSVA
jgi:hypothetical protein